MTQPHDRDLDRLIADHQAYVRRELRRQASPGLLEQESVSDLTQSVAREALCQRHRFERRSDGEFRSWLRRVIRSKIVGRQRFLGAGKRDRGREAVVPEVEVLDANTPSRVVGRREELALVERALEQLPADHATALRLAFFEQLPRQEIAARLGRTHEATRQLLTRAKVRLVLLLEADELTSTSA